MGLVRVKVAADCSEALAFIHAVCVDIATGDHGNAMRMLERVYNGI